MGFAADPLILLPITAAIILGGLGVPVLYELTRRGGFRLGLHSKVTLWMSAVLIGYGMVALTLSEWTNPATMGGQATGTKVLIAWFQSVSPRTAGYNSIDYADMRPESWLITDTLMFIGGGSVSTSGGIRVTTLAVILLVIRSQARGDRDTTVAGRRLSQALTQQALLITVLFAALSFAGTLGLMALSDVNTGQALFEVISAIGTVGLSTGITGELGAPAQVLLSLLMFIGRIGPTTLATALALRQSDARYRYPEGRVLVG
jgi:Trk-type K+ transport system membrane component